MRDLVETVIAQVIKQQPYNSAAPSKARVPAGRDAIAVKGYAPSSPPDRSEIKDEKLWDVSRKFEAIFMQQMMAAMRKSIPKSDFLPSGFAEGVHDSMMDQAIAKTGSKSGGLGIAIQIYRQLEASEAGRTTAIQGIEQTTDNVGMDVYNNSIRGGRDGSY